MPRHIALPFSDGFGPSLGIWLHIYKPCGSSAVFIVLALPPSIQLVSMMYSSALEVFVDSVEPKPFDLTDFLIHMSKVPQFFEAPVRSVDCYRQGVHDYLILSCEVTMPSTDTASIVWLRLERNPSSKSMSMFSGKPNPAADTVKVHRDLSLIHKPCDSRGHLIYHTTDTPPTILRLQHILDMYKYLAQRSPSYSMYKANCRWFCFGIFEFLRHCQRCYGGHWMGSKAQSTLGDDQGALEAMNDYLKAIHPTCCFPAKRSILALQTLAAEAARVGATAAVVGAMANSMIHNVPNMTDPAVIYSTTGPPASVPAAQPTQPAARPSGFSFSSSPNPQPRPTQYHEGRPTMDRSSVPQSAGYPSYPPNMHPGMRPYDQPQPQPTRAPSQAPSYVQPPAPSHGPPSSYGGSCAHSHPLSQPSIDAHSEYYQHPGGQGFNNTGPFPQSPVTRVGTIGSCFCGGHSANAGQPPPPPPATPPPAPPKSRHACGPQCHHQNQAYPQLDPPHEPQPRSQYPPQPQPQARPPPPSSNYSYPPPPPPPQARDSMYSSLPESAYDPPQYSTASYRSSMHIPPYEQPQFAPQNSWRQSQRGPSHAPAPPPPPPPPSHQATCSCTQHVAALPPAYEPVPQASPHGRGFTNQVNETPGGAFVGTGAPDYNQHNHMYGVPQPQPMQPIRTWTERVWSHETTGPPLRTESPDQMVAPTDGAIPNGMPAFGASIRMPDTQDYLNGARNAYTY
ncbi:hypothetical protein BDV93DRAFT_14479 [Ceratobasidium sp. AG-I]|nr:hypothetical protein BDV93DRAFT_14479 [Ceratobasidium sp. AG-I]